MSAKLNRHPALNQRAFALHQDYKRNGVSAWQMPRNTLPFSQIIVGLHMSKQINAFTGGFTTEEVAAAFKKNDFRMPSPSSFNSMMNSFCGDFYGNKHKGFSKIRGKWYAKQSTEFIIAKVAQKLNSLPYNSRYRRIRLLVGGDSNFIFSTHKILVDAWA